VATIVTRAGKGAALTHQEVDANFTGLNTELGQKEVASNKGVANGYASLDAAGKVPSTQLPSYVDDVVEVANFASLPGTGETGKIYVTIDTNKTYRWTGSTYIEISASPGSTDSLAEGSTNLYFTQARARTSISASGSLSYNSSTGVMSFSDAVTSVAGRTGAVTLTSSDVGLGNVENKSSATIRGEITLSNVTTALGFTPYNSTNPNSYITSSASITGSSRFVAFLDTRSTNDQPQGKTGYALSADFKSNSSVSSPPVTASALYSHILTVAGWDTNGGSGGWPSQLSIGDGIAIRQATSESTWGSWRTVAHSGNFTSFALSSGQVTTALGYTPYNSTNPSGYITSSALSSYLPLSGGTMTGNASFAQGANINFGSSTNEAGPWTISVIGSGGATPATKGTGRGRNLIIKAGDSDNGAGLAGGDLFLRGGSPTSPSVVYGDVRIADLGGQIYLGLGDTTTASITDQTNYSSPLIIQRASNAGKGAVVLRGSDSIGSAIEFGRSNSASHWGTYFEFLVHDDNTVGLTGLTRKFRIDASAVNSLVALQQSGNQVLHAANYSGYALPLSGGTITGDVGIGSGFNGFNAISGTERTLYIANSNAAALYLHATGGSGKKWTIYSSSGGGLTIYDATGGTSYPLQITTAAANFSVALQQSGNQVLHAANYSSYALPISGGTITGTLNISGGGSQPLTLTTSSSSPWGFGLTRSDAGVSSKVFLHNGSGSWAWVYEHNPVFYNGGAYSPFLHSGNYTSYSPSLTGSGASGTWSINVTGSAGSASLATDADRLRTYDHRIKSPNSDAAGRAVFGFTSWANNNTAPWADYLHLRSYTDGSGGADNLVMFRKDAIGMRIWQQSFGSSSAYSSYVDVLHSSNYSSYALPLSGGTLSGNLSGTTIKATTAFYHGAFGYWKSRDNGGGGELVFEYSTSSSIADANIKVTFSSGGNVTATGNVTAYSDERVKANWRSLDDGFVVNLANVKSGIYDRTDVEITQAGVSAQSLREVLPEAVIESHDGDLSVAYGNAAMVSAIELAKELVALKKEVAELRARVH
jgi:hypothetical protein